MCHVHKTKTYIVIHWKQKSYLGPPSSWSYSSWIYNYLCNQFLSPQGPSWSWTYGSWIYNHLCDQCLSPQELSWSWSYGSWIYNYMCNQSLSPQELSWSWSYGSWINNYLCNQCLSPLMLWVRTTLIARCSRYNVMLVSDLLQVSGFLRVLRFPPPIKLTARI